MPAGTEPRGRNPKQGTNWLAESEKHAPVRTKNMTDPERERGFAVTPALSLVTGGYVAPALTAQGEIEPFLDFFDTFGLF